MIFYLVFYLLNSYQLFYNKSYSTICFLFSVSCFYLLLFSLLQPFYQQLYLLRRISCFFRSSLTFTLGDIKQKTRLEAKRQDVKNNKRQETGNKKHIVKQAL